MYDFTFVDDESEENKGDASKLTEAAPVATSHSPEFAWVDDKTPEEATSESEAPEVEAKAFEFKTVNFTLNKNEVRKDQVAKIEHDSEIAKSAVETGKKVVVQGHCCQLGSYSYNMALSQRRADVIKKEMVKRGVSEDSIKTVGYGSEMPLVWSDKTDKKFEVTEEDIKYIFENIGSVPEDYKNPKEFEIVNLFNRISQENYQKTPIDKKDYISLIEKSANDILRIIRKDSYDVLTDNQKLLFLKDELEDIERNLVNFKIIQCKNSDLELLSGKIQEAVNVINSNLCLTSSPLYHLVHNRKPSFIDLKVKSIHIGIIKNALYSITDSIALYKALNPVPVYKPTVFSGIISTVNDLETQVAKYTEEDIFAQDALDNAFETKQGIKEAKKKSLEITRKLRMSENLLRDALDKLAELDISDISKLV